MNKTKNYQLSQWEKKDRVLMEDFNADNAKIDAALGNLRDGKTDKSTTSALQAQMDTKSQVIIGKYTGNGASSRFISLGVTPLAVFVIPANGELVNTGVRFGGLAITDSKATGYAEPAVEIVSNGFTVHSTGSGTTAIAVNTSPFVYHYIAFC